MVDLVPYWQPAPVDEPAQRETYLAAERRVGLATAIGHMGVGTPGRAYAAVMRTYLRQVRILGYAYAGIPGRPYEEMGPIR
jgi:hypothetical protein